MLLTLNGETRKRGTRPMSRFQLHKKSVNILYILYYLYLFDQIYLRCGNSILGCLKLISSIVTTHSAVRILFV